MTWVSDMERDNLRRVIEYATATRMAHHGDNEQFSAYIFEMRSQAW